MSKPLLFKATLTLLGVFLLWSCDKQKLSEKQETQLIILGVTQDAGAPQIACIKECCKRIRKQGEKHRVVSLGLFDASSESTYLFEASPDFKSQVYDLQRKFGKDESGIPDGIFLTHAHIGHYTGLMYLGKESTNAEKVEVFTMPRMKQFLSDYGPWNLMVQNNNIKLNEISDQAMIMLSKQLIIQPLKVPHRDEYSETVGYKIEGPKKTALFIPDIDKWSKWSLSIDSLVQEVDYAFLDATFFDNQELNNRDMSEVPHPFVLESIARFENLSKADKAKIHFIHFNHSNPLLDSNSEAYKTVLARGFKVAKEMQIFSL